MKNEIATLEPQVIWKHFYNITQIPRPSYSEKEICNYLVEFAKEHKLNAKVDGVGNVIISKPAYQGKEDAKGVVLQTHVDMVPQKNSDKVHDFLKDPIEAYIDGDWVTANGTTLGADNGIGIAAALALLESDNVQHGPLEALFTVTEETGMDGAFGLQPGDLKGSIMLNLDSEEEGELYIGCAGGVDVNIEGSYKTEETENRKAAKLTLKGLKGGHSGMDINLGRGNANIDLLLVLKQISENFDVRLYSFSGGNLRNAIPRESEAIITFDGEEGNELKNSFTEITKEITSAYKDAEPELIFSFEETAGVSSQMTAVDQERMLQILATIPNGVLQMTPDLPDVVQTSNNTAVVEIGEGKLMVKMLLRSSSDQEKKNYGEILKNHFSILNPNTSFSGAYPGWLPNSKSEILQKAQQCYQELFHKKPEVKVIHAGLECGIIGSKYPELDMVSFGPTIKFPHSPDEKVHIASVGEFWRFLVGIVERI